MNKAEFLSALRERLSQLPREEVEERLGFYSEMIDDRVEEGLPEENAVSAIGSVEEVASQIISDIPLSRIIKNKVKKKRRMKAWEIVFLVLGAPIWLSLLVAAISVAFSLYAVLWSVVIALWATFGGLLGGGVGLIPLGVILAFKGSVLTGIAFIGIALTSVGLSIFFFFISKWASMGLVLLTKKIFLCIKKGFVGKENE